MDVDQPLTRARWLREKAKAAPESDVAAAAAGLLAAKALDAKADEADVVEFVRRLLAAKPASGKARDSVAWLLATEALHNVGGEPWETWQEALHRTLIADQVRRGCAEGSWDPAAPSDDAWRIPGGRLFVTAMSVLALEVGVFDARGAEKAK